MKKKLDKSTIKLIVMVSIINIVIGTLLSSSISYAINGYSSREVSYSPNNSNWKVSNVDDALTSLYAMTNAQGVLPVGTISSIMGNSAPTNFLKCDGTVYNIKDYPELAKYFKNQFGKSNQFGGDGTTTFAVPDLRGEFLRGTGTNSRAYQGSGSAVGTHQDATEHIRVIGHTSGTIQAQADSATGPWSYPLNLDSTRNYGTHTWINASVSGKGTDTNYTYYTARPTNTSVLYIIATKDIYVEGKTNYSTDEKVVGTWIDGKPLYQRTIDGLNEKMDWVGTHAYTRCTINAPINNVDRVIFATGYMSTTNGGEINWTQVANINFQSKNSTTWYVNSLEDYYLRGLTVQYTKTTD